MATAEDVDGFVKANITDVNAIAQDAVTNAKIFLDELAQAIPESPPYLEIDDFPVNLDRVSLRVEAPERPNIENLVDDAEIPLLGDINLPNVPSDISPSAPVLEDITLPDPPSTNILPFTLEFPEDTITDSDIAEFEYTEAEYISGLQDAVKAKLLYDVENGGTGLDEDIETAIFERGAERDLIALEEAVQNLTSEWGKSGFPLPTGALAAQIKDIYDNYENTKLDRSRDISIKQAELAQTNTHFAITSSLTMEGILMQHANNVANRALEAAKAVTTMSIAVFNVQVERFKARLGAYKTGAEAYEAQLRGELAKVDIYKAEMEGAKLATDVQQQRVSIYGLQVEAVNSLYSRYRTQVEAARVTASIEAERLSSFKVRVEAQLDKVRALVATYEADISRYNASIRDGEAWANVEIKQRELLSRNHEAALSLAMETARINLQAFIQITGMQVQQAEGGASIYNNLAATALSSLNSVIQLGSTSAVTSTETTE